ncbi:MAG: cyclic nucleotide-binding domain-containing protein [Rhodobacterales bacterium]|nr:cyclic nucleotide-binding domain-containing protein [Rhodobacterales bacterium]
MKSIFIIGEQRSGSNLLRLMLSQAGVAAPHPPHILKRMLPLEASYGDLSLKPNWEHLVDDVCRLVDRNPVAWSEVCPLDRAQVAAGCRHRTCIAIFESIMDLYASSRGLDTWACKSMQYSEYVNEIEDHFSGALYLYLHRDVRDVTLSFSRAVVGEKHPYFISKRWASLQQAAMKVREVVGSDRFFPVCYEELITNPEPLLRSLCEFMGMAFKPEMMEFHRSTEARTASGRSQLWENVDRPLMRNNSRKFLLGLSQAEIQICESVAGPELDALGYDRVATESGSERNYGPEEIESFQRENDRLKIERRSMMDVEDAARRKDQLSVMTERVQYLDELDHSQLVELLGYLEEQHMTKGTQFIEQGSVEDHMFFIVAGTVEVLSGSEVLVTLQRGACVGEVGMLSSMPRTRTLRAASDTRLLRLSWVRMQQMMEDSPKLASRLLWLISGSLAKRFASVSS